MSFTGNVTSCWLLLLKPVQGVTCLYHDGRALGAVAFPSCCSDGHHVRLTTGKGCDITGSATVNTTAAGSLAPRGLKCGCVCESSNAVQPLHTYCPSVATHRHIYTLRSAWY